MNGHLYDIIIAGSGAAGLSLAYHLLQSPLRDRSLLIIDKDDKACNERTWCFWADRPTLFDDIIYRYWSRLRIVGRTVDAAAASTACSAFSPRASGIITSPSGTSSAATSTTCRST